MLKVQLSVRSPTLVEVRIPTQSAFRAVSVRHEPQSMKTVVVSRATIPPSARDSTQRSTVITSPRLIATTSTLLGTRHVSGSSGFRLNNQLKIQVHPAFFVQCATNDEIKPTFLNSPFLSCKNASAPYRNVLEGSVAHCKHFSKPSHLRVVLLASLNDLHLVVRAHPGRPFAHDLFERPVHCMIRTLRVPFTTAAETHVNVYLCHNVAEFSH